MPLITPPTAARSRFPGSPTATTWKSGVQDTGIGIEPEEIPKIFDKFYRVKHPKTRQVIGTGLGLSLVKGLRWRRTGVRWKWRVKWAGARFSGSCCPRLPAERLLMRENDPNRQILVVDDEEAIRNGIAQVAVQAEPQGGHRGRRPLRPWRCWPGGLTPSSCWTSRCRTWTGWRC